jgi:hypothetical protein
MLKAYLDETDSNKQGEVCVVAGFMGSRQQWDDLGKEWQSILNERKRKPLHMAGLGWGRHEQALQALLAKLGPLPDKHGLTRIMGACGTQIIGNVSKGEFLMKLRCRIS